MIKSSIISAIMGAFALQAWGTASHSLIATLSMHSGATADHTTTGATAVFPDTILLGATTATNKQLMMTFKASAGTRLRDSAGGGAATFVYCDLTIANGYATRTVTATGAVLNTAIRICNGAICTPDGATSIDSKTGFAAVGESAPNMEYISLTTAASGTEEKLVTSSAGNKLYVMSDSKTAEAGIAPHCGMTMKADLSHAANATNGALTKSNSATAGTLECSCEIGGDVTQADSKTTIPIKMIFPVAPASISLEFLTKKSTTDEKKKDADIVYGDLEPITQTASTGDDLKVKYAFDSSAAVENDTFSGTNGKFVFTSTTAKYDSSASGITNLMVTTPDKDNAWDVVIAKCSWVAVNCSPTARVTLGISPVAGTAPLRNTTNTVKKIGDCSSGGGGGSSASPAFTLAISSLLAIMGIHFY